MAGLIGRSSPLEIRVLRLQPSPRPAAHVARADAFRDDAFGDLVPELDDAFGRIVLKNS